MSDDDRTVADVLLSSTENSDPRVNVGEHTDGEGFGADTALWANGTGFLAIPAPADASGAAQVVVEQDGDVKRAVASRDNRYAGKAGTLVAGDAAIVTPGDAFAKFTSALAKILFQSTDMSIALDGASGSITIAKGPASITMTTAGGLVLAFAPAPGPPLSSISLGPGGNVLITGAALQFNGVPIIVP